MGDRAVAAGTTRPRTRHAGEVDQRVAIISAVLEVIEADGYDAVRLRDVATRARVSLATIYRLFGTREDLIFRSLERWREDTVYEGLDDGPPDEALGDGLIRIFRHIFEPWERKPHLLEAFHRVRTQAHGDRLTADGTMAVRPVVRALFADEDPAEVDEVLAILEYVVYGAVGLFVEGKIAVTDILPAIERTVRRLTRDGSGSGRVAGGRARRTRG